MNWVKCIVYVFNLVGYLEAVGLALYGHYPWDNILWVEFRNGWVVVGCSMCEGLYWDLGWWIGHCVVMLIIFAD